MWKQKREREREAIKQRIRGGRLLYINRQKQTGKKTDRQTEADTETATT